MWLCDSCAAQLVLKKLIRPASEVHIEIKAPWEYGSCEHCNRKDNITNHIEARESMFEERIYLLF